MNRYIVTELATDFLAHQVRIITPTKAIARSLTTPHHSLESLAQIAVRQQGWKIASSLLSRRYLQDAVSEVIKTKDIEGTAAAFLGTIKELFRAGVDLTKLGQQPSLRVRQLAELAINYQQRLRRDNYLDGSELFWQGAKNVKYRQAYLFYGYFAPALDELVFIDGVGKDNSVIVLPPTEATETSGFLIDDRDTLSFLQNRGWQLNTSPSDRVTVRDNHADLGKKLQKCWLIPASLPPEAVLYCYPDRITEIRGILTQVKVLLSQGVITKDIVLVAKDEQLYGDSLIDIAWEYNLTLRVLYEIPLEQTRMGAWLKLLLEVIDTNFAFEATAQLLSHSLVQLMTEEKWSQARQTHPQNISAWQELGIDLSLLQFPSSDRRDGWRQRLQNILANWEILEHGKAWAREVLAYYKIQAALGELGRPPAEKISRNSLIRDLKDTLALLTVPAQPGSGGVELHTPESLIGTKYQYVFVLGMGDGIFPKTIADDPILDFSDRHQLARQGFNLATAAERARTEALTFYHLLGIATKSTIFSYPQLIDKQTILPSYYLNRLGLQPTTLPNLPLASIETTRQLYLRQPQAVSDRPILKIIQAWQVETHRESNLAPDEYDGVIKIAIEPASKIFSASQLTRLGQCPFKWFASRLLKLKELPEAESDLSSTFRGNLYHRCLELSLAKIKTASDLETFNQQQLATAFRQAEQELQLTRLPGWEARRQEHLDLLYQNLLAADFLPPDREVIARETEFKTQWHGLQVQGTIDRIDRTATGLTIIDYKTSSNIPAGVKDNTGKANLDIQLALYIDAIEQSQPEMPVEKAVYYSLTKSKAMGRAKKNPEQLAAFAERVKSHLEQGYYPVNPDRDCQACQYCAFDSVCRRGNRLNRKFTDEI